MIFDFDDFHESNHQLERLHALKDINPAFRCTVFAVPGLGSNDFWASVPAWIELAVHGWYHNSVYECLHWTEERMRQVMAHPIVRRWFVRGFKAPGWQISEGCYQALLKTGWWVADHHENDGRRPLGILSHRLSTTASFGRDDNHWHGHIQNVCGNGMQETWDVLCARVEAAQAFETVGESVRSWQARAAA